MRYMPGWRNWQTRRTQNPVLAREWEFDPPSGHHHFTSAATVLTTNSLTKTLSPTSGADEIQMNRRYVSPQHHIEDVVAENILT